MSKVSVLIPCFNSARWIADTVASVRSQTYKSIEIIVVDDGSTDDSLVILDHLSGPDLKIITQENGGAGAARNRALEVAQGDYIQYLDSDDLLGPTKLETQIASLSESPPDTLAVCPVIYFNDGGSTDLGWLHRGWPFVDAPDPAEWLVELLGPETGSMVPLHSWLSPRTLIDRVGPWSSVRSSIDDGEFFCRVVLASAGIKACEPAVCFYRKRPISSRLSGKRDSLHKEGHLRHLDEIATAVLARVPSKRTEKAVARLYLDFAVSVYPEHASLTSAALRKVRALGGAPRPRIGGVTSEVLAQLVGWRAARIAQNLLRPYLDKFRAL